MEKGKDKQLDGMDEKKRNIETDIAREMEDGAAKEWRRRQKKGRRGMETT